MTCISCLQQHHGWVIGDAQEPGMASLNHGQQEYMTIINVAQNTAIFTSLSYIPRMMLSLDCAFSMQWLPSDTQVPSICHSYSHKSSPVPANHRKTKLRLGIRDGQLLSSLLTYTSIYTSLLTYLLNCLTVYLKHITHTLIFLVKLTSQSVLLLSTVCLSVYLCICLSVKHVDCDKMR